jgi:ATP-dependent protease ClpP protease subunit
MIERNSDRDNDLPGAVAVECGLIDKVLEKKD